MAERQAHSPDKEQTVAAGRRASGTVSGGAGLGVTLREAEAGFSMPDAARLLTVQRFAGNRAVGRLLAASRPAAGAGGLAVQRAPEKDPDGKAEDDYIDKANGNVKLKKVRGGYQVVGKEGLGTLRYDSRAEKYYDADDVEVSIGNAASAGNTDRYVEVDKGVGVVAGQAAVK